MRTPSGDYAKGPCSTCSTAGCKSQEAGLYRLALRGHPYGAGKFQSLPDSVLPSRSSSREDSIGRCFDINEVTLSESAVSLVCLVMPCHSCCKLCQIFFNYHNVNGPSPVLAYRNKCQSCLNLRSDATAAKTKSSKQNANHMSNNPGNHVKKNQLDNNHASCTRIFSIASGLHLLSAHLNFLLLCFASAGSVAMAGGTTSSSNLFTHPGKKQCNCLHPN